MMSTITIHVRPRACQSVRGGESDSTVVGERRLSGCRHHQWRPIAKHHLDYGSAIDRHRTGRVARRRLLQGNTNYPMWSDAARAWHPSFSTGKW